MGKTHFVIKCEGYKYKSENYKLVYEFYQSDGTTLKMLGFNFVGTMKAIVLAFGDVRVKISDRIGNVIEEKLHVTLEQLEVKRLENIICWNRQCAIVVKSY